MRVLLRRIIRVIAGCLCLALAAGVVVVVYTLAQLPALDAFREPARYGELLEKMHPPAKAVNPAPCTYADLPAPLVDAFLAAFNPRYFTEPGHDVWYFNQPTRDLIELFMPKADRKGLAPWAMLRFSILSHRLTWGLSKEEILCAYLNTFRYEPGVYGINTAALRYLGKDVSRCDLRECVMLMAVTLSNVAPRGRPRDGERLEWIGNFILKRMLDYGMISEEERAEVKKTGFRLAYEGQLRL